MTLGINPSGNRKADKFQLRVDDLAVIRIGVSEHDRADLTGAYGTFQVEFDRQGLAGEFSMRNVRQKGAGINVNGMTSGGLDGGNANRVDAFH
jgi:phage head maturation protease